MNRNAGLLLLLSVATSLQANGLAQEKGGGEKPTLQVQLLKTELIGHNLKLNWKAVNNGATAVYVYATFLRGPVAAYEIADKNVLVINTSLMRVSPVGVNFYPKAEFLKLAPGESMKGTLRDAELPDSVLKVRPKAAMLNIAYGLEIAQVEQALRAARLSDQHPANPIVEWQTIAHSNAFALQ